MIRQKTESQLRIESIERAVEAVELAIAATARTLDNAFNVLWSYPEAELLESLNEIGVQETIDMFTKHLTGVTYINQLLDSINSNAQRAVGVAPRQLTIVDGMIAFVPLPEEQTSEELVSEE